VKLRSILIWTIGIAAFGAFMYFTALPGDFPAAEQTAGLSGTYTVNGVDPLGVEYSGTVVIAETDVVDRFDVEWIVTGGIHRGFGQRSNGVLTVDWEAIASGGGTGAGIARYTIESDGRLVGSKSVTGFDKVGTEEIFPSP
jgi:hypothetical protein